MRGKRIWPIVLLLLLLPPLPGSAREPYVTQSMIEEPERYIIITDWHLYAVARVAVLHHVTIENTADIPYKDIRVKVYYYSTSYPSYGILVGSTTGTLPITLPPKSKETYLRHGITLGGGSIQMLAKGIVVFSATPVVEGNRLPAMEGPRLTL